MTLGLNEFSGYVGVALAGIITGYAAAAFGPREGLLIFGLLTIGLALLLTQVWVRDTLPWAKLEAANHSKPPAANAFRPRYAKASDKPDTWEVFALMSWRDRRLAAVSQAGLVEKFVDALVWVMFPVFLYAQGVSLPNIGWIVGVYGFVWGGSQLFTGRLSDHIGRFWPNVLGMWICGAGIGMVVLGTGVVWWSLLSRRGGLWNGTSVSQPLGSSGGHHVPRLAGFPRSASTVSGVTLATASGLWGWGSRRISPEQPMVRSGSWRSRCSLRGRFSGGGARRRTRV